MRTTYAYRRHIKRANKFNRKFKRNLQRTLTPLRKRNKRRFK